MSDYADNVWTELDEIDEGIRGKRLPRPEGARLVAAVWELEPGSQGVDYHVHHGIEELLIVLRGRPTLHGAEGHRELEEGEVVHFPPGPVGAHTVSNQTDEPVRYVMAAAPAHALIDIIEYPAKGTFVAGAKTPSQHGDPFFVRLPFPGSDVD